MPYGTGRSGDNVRIAYDAGWSGLQQHVNVATPKDAAAAFTRTAITAKDIPDVGPYSPLVIAPFDLLDGNYILFNGSSTVANTTLSFVLICYAETDSYFISDALALNVGGFYKVGSLFIPVDGGAVAGPMIGVKSVAVCITNVTGGTWVLKAKVCY